MTDELERTRPLNRHVGDGGLRGKVTPEGGIPGWYCEHHDYAATGEKAKHWEMYCRNNRHCKIADDGCRAMIIMAAEVTP